MASVLVARLLEGLLFGVAPTDPATLADGGRLLAAGLLVGLVASVLVARLLEGLLFGVAPSDPATLAAVSLLMVGVGLAACAVPASRAASVDPLVAMRAE